MSEKKKEVYDSTWLILEQLESLERMTEQNLRFLKQTRKSIEKSVKEAEREELRGL